MGILGYGVGTWGYVRLYRRRGATIVLTFAVAFALLAVAFGLIAVAARREWHEERFSALYLEQTLEGTTEASIMFADLKSFAPYSERTYRRRTSVACSTPTSRGSSR